MVSISQHWTLNNTCPAAIWRNRKYRMSLSWTILIPHLHQAPIYIYTASPYPFSYARCSGKLFQANMLSGSKVTWWYFLSSWNGEIGSGSWPSSWEHLSNVFIWSIYMQKRWAGVRLCSYFDINLESSFLWEWQRLKLIPHEINCTNIVGRLEYQTSSMCQTASSERLALC